MSRKVKSFSLIIFIFSLIFLFSNFHHLFFSKSVNSISTLSHAVRSNSIHALQEQDNHPKLDRRNIISSLRPEAILLPDWQVLLLLPPQSISTRAHANLTCHFQNGATSSAKFNGIIPSSGRTAFHCLLPQTVQILRPFISPRLISSNGSNLSDFDSDSDYEMMRWKQIVYDSIITRNDVILFVKGLNTRSGISFSHKDIWCVYLSMDDTSVATYVASSSAQEVVRCLHPSTSTNSDLSINSLIVKISIAIGTSLTPIPSLADYNPSHVMLQYNVTNEPSLLCACTMVYNVAKFLREWVFYHSSIGIQKFFLYDNGSDDELGPTVRQLLNEGYDVSTYYWPWPKTQEAGFSHCAAVNLQNCHWMAFIDVDEFIFSPSWSESPKPNPTMLASLVNSMEPTVSQILMNCYDFSPSGHMTHPKNGVTQGYTCRRKSTERHKSIVRLDVVDLSLVNSVHHFRLKEGFETRKLDLVHVNHYKYQAWDEFKLKFRRRVSAYVVDWKDRLNPSSKDRTPGLGFEPVEPSGWANMFCEVNDTLLRDLTRRWFEIGLSEQVRGVQKTIDPPNPCNPNRTDPFFAGFEIVGLDPGLNFE
ncbi:hypothetical protein LUZ60_011971 [Juncus effusus]|nr:hypothetical protein LUZ60_011971 [Juncus effusus]